MTIKIANGLDLLNQRITNLGDGSSPTDAVTLQQLQAYARGLDWKASVRAASVGNLTLSGTQTIDGVAVIAGDRVLVMNQSTASQNGVYVAASGSWSRATDTDVDAEVTSGMAVTVTEGTTNGDKVYILTTNDPISIDSTSLAFTQLGGGVSYTAGNGLTLATSQFSIQLDTGSGLIVGAGGLKIDSEYSGLAKRYAVNVPNGSTTATITHNLGTLDVTVAVYEISTGALVLADITLTSTSALTLTFAAAPTAAQYRCVVTG